MTNPFFFPGEGTFPVDFVCEHCGEVMPIVGGKVVLCDCQESRLYQVTERERGRAFHREMKQRPPVRRKRKDELGQRKD